MGGTKRFLEEGHLAIFGHGPFKPTHQHADGGHYQHLGLVAYNQGNGWTDIVEYMDGTGKKWYTSQARWAKRFTPIEGTAQVFGTRDSREGD